MTEDTAAVGRAFSRSAQTNEDFSGMTGASFAEFQDLDSFGIAINCFFCFLSLILDTGARLSNVTNVFDFTNHPVFFNAVIY